MPELRHDDPGIKEFNADGTVTLRPTPSVEQPRTATGQALLRWYGNLKDDHRPNTAKMRDRIVAIEAEAAQDAARQRDEAVEWRFDAQTAMREYLREHGMREGSDAFALLSAALKEAELNGATPKARALLRATEGKQQP